MVLNPYIITIGPMTASRRDVAQVIVWAHTRNWKSERCSFMSSANKPCGSSDILLYQRYPHPARSFSLESPPPSGAVSLSHWLDTFLWGPFYSILLDGCWTDKKVPRRLTDLGENPAGCLTILITRKALWGNRFSRGGPNHAAGS